MVSLPALFSRKKRQFLLSVGDEGAVLVYMVGAAVEGRFFFQAPDAPELERVFAGDTEASVKVLVDVSDQSYLLHTLPPVSAMSVQSMARRRLEKEFDRNDIKGALLLNRSTGARKDWNFIFASVRNAPPLSDWLNALTNFPNPIVGLYLLPVETEPLIRRLKKAIEVENVAEKAQWQMLVTHHKTGGLRQTVYKDGRLLFTRMAQPVGGNAPGVIAGHIEQESLNTLEYLRRLNYEESAGLDLFIITSAEVKKQLETTRFKAAKLYVLTPHEVATQLNLERATEPKDKFADVVLLAQFGQQRKAILKLTTPQLEEVRKYQWGMLGLKACAVVLLPLLLLFLCYNIYTSVTVANRSTQAEEVLRKTQSEQRTLQQRADAQAERRTEVKEMVALYEEHSSEAVVPFTFLAVLEQAKGPFARYDNFRFATTTTRAPDAKTKKPVPGISFAAPITYPKRSDDAQSYIKEVEAFAERTRARFAGLEVSFTGLPGQSNYTLSVEGGPTVAGAAPRSTLPKESGGAINLSITGPLKEAADRALFVLGAKIPDAPVPASTPTPTPTPAATQGAKP